MASKTVDILICGGGIVGLTIARELVNRGYENIAVIEKESGLGVHSSGRNSGVLHSGIYYKPGGMRAVSCMKGNLLMSEYCTSRGLPFLKLGKVIVTKDENDLKTLDILHERAKSNEAEVELIDESRLKGIEPNARTYRSALYSPNTAVIDPKAVLNSIKEELLKSGKVEICFGTELKGIEGSTTALTSDGKVKFRLFINAAGAHSDKVAHLFSIGSQYKILPFKGIYYKLRREKSNLVNGNIYPVPDIKNPFLGVHFTKSISGDVYIGPTAIPAFGRENYGIFEGMDSEFLEIAMRDLVMFFTNKEFRRVALSEPKKYIFKYFYEDASRLIRNLSPEDVVRSNKVGIRPQLVDWKSKKLVTDFHIIEDANSIHILNAISPAFTSSLYFASHLFENRIAKLKLL